jgi:uncharacterized protein YyaL (SSP411 family)
VHWRSWGEAALLKRPITLSTSYLACHWCLVMQRKPFSQMAAATRIKTSSCLSLLITIRTAGGFFSNAAKTHARPVRERQVIDGPNPFSNACAVSLFARLYFHAGVTRWRDLENNTLLALSASATSRQLGIDSLLNAAYMLQEAPQAVIIGGRGETGFLQAVTTSPGRKVFPVDA